MIITLQRLTSETDGTFGQLVAYGNTLCFTVELPWLDNRPQVSCIPTGTYDCIPHNSPLHPNTWEVSNVPNRSEILIHNANLAKQLLGCIGVGDAYGMFDGIKGVTNSVKTLNMLRATLPPNFTLIIQ